MATTTPNFGWPVPTSTDLVKDGATAMEALGDAIDTSMVDLKGGTTGQILSKASGTDMDFTWIANDQGDITGVTAGTGISGGGTSGTVTVTNSMATTITTKGDLVPGTGSGTFARLGVGADNEVLVADSTAATGLKYSSTVSDATVSTAARGYGYMGIPASAAAATGAYTIVAADAGEHIYTTATRTVTIPANSAVAFPVGTAITFVAATGATVTIAINTDTLILAGPGTTGSRTLAPFGMATALKITSTSWIISGNGLT